MPPRRTDLPEVSLGSAFAKALAEEQQARGWSDAGLAERASRMYPISASTIWKIKHATPPRRVDLDEASAILHAFGIPSVDEFLSNRSLQSFVEFCDLLGEDLDEACSRIRRMSERLAVLRNLAETAISSTKPDRHPETWVDNRLSELAADAKAAREDTIKLAEDLDALAASFRKGARRGRK